MYERVGRVGPFLEPCYVQQGHPKNMTTPLQWLQCWLQTFVDSRFVERNNLSSPWQPAHMSVLRMCRAFHRRQSAHKCSKWAAWHQVDSIGGIWFLWDPLGLFRHVQTGLGSSAPRTQLHPTARWIQWHDTHGDGHCLGSEEPRLGTKSCWGVRQEA